MSDLSVLQWDCMLTLCWTTNVYSDVASLAVAAATPEKTTVLAANLISPQVVVGELRSRRKTEEGLEVAAMLDGKAPVAVSPTGEVVVCASAQDQGGLLVYTHQHRRGWTQVASLSAHTDQIASIAINSDTSQLCAAAWDGKVSIWCLGINLNCQTLTTFCSRENLEKLLPLNRPTSTIDLHRKNCTQ